LVPLEVARAFCRTGGRGRGGHEMGQDGADRTGRIGRTGWTGWTGRRHHRGVG